MPSGEALALPSSVVVLAPGAPAQTWFSQLYLEHLEHGCLSHDSPPAFWLCAHSNSLLTTTMNVAQCLKAYPHLPAWLGPTAHRL